MLAVGDWVLNLYY